MHWPIAMIMMAAAADLLQLWKVGSLLRNMGASMGCIACKEPSLTNRILHPDDMQSLTSRWPNESEAELASLAEAFKILDKDHTER